MLWLGLLRVVALLISHYRWSDLEVAGISSSMVGEANQYVEPVGEDDGRPFQVQARAVRLNQNARSPRRGGRGGRGGRGRTGSTGAASDEVAATGGGDEGIDGAGEDEHAVTEGNVHGLPVETPRLSPPPGWTVAADGRFMPPPGLPHATPQATVVAAWAVHRQLSRLASALVLDDAVRARTRHGA